MRCKNCGKDIDNVWGFCPYCGALVGGLEDSFTNFARMLGGKAVVRQDGDSFIIIIEFQGMRHAFRITPLDLEEVLPSTPPPEPVSPKVKREFEHTKEPKTEVNYLEDRIYVKVNLPGIPEEDVEIEQLENSLEVRAYEGKIRYFKLITIPEEYNIASKEFLPDEVIVTLTKR